MDERLEQLLGEMQLDTREYLENLISRIKNEHAELSPMQQMDCAIAAILEVGFGPTTEVEGRPGFV